MMGSENVEQTPTPQQQTVPERQEDKTPVIDGEFDPERMKRLVANVRAENADTKKQLAALKTVEQRLVQVEQQLAEAQKTAAAASEENMRLREDARKRELLAEHGLGKEYARFLTGDSEQEWLEDIVLLARTSEAEGADDSDTSVPLSLGVDFAQGHETRTQHTGAGDARLAQALKIFGQ